ncbi:MAG: type IV toxin-antitoxin system AbiEi family antitoxin domain-containing protein, partial [Dissulfurispiraceae bacterium]
MEPVSGLGKEDRKRLSAIFRETKGTVSVKDTADILKVDTTVAAKMLSRWAKKGWLSRIRRGLYVPIAFESRTTDITLEDPW